jgi:hypothetical protein
MAKQAWEKEAFKRFPELRKFDPMGSAYVLWPELAEAFKRAYRAPRNEDLIARIYAFADWCCSQPPGDNAENDLATCVSVCFYEHIPESPEALKDMPRWFSRSEVIAMKETFSYLVDEEGFQTILAAFTRHHRLQKKTGKKKLRRRT